MKVRARHWVKTDSGWHSTGDIFEVETLDGLAGMVDVIEMAKPEPKPVEAEMAETVKPTMRKRGRKQSQ